MGEEMNHELLKATAEEHQKKKTELNKKEYVPRPLYQRVLAWILVILVIIGVILFYFWFFHTKPQ